MANWYSARWVNPQWVVASWANTTSQSISVADTTSVAFTEGYYKYDGTTPPGFWYNNYWIRPTWLADHWVLQQQEESPFIASVDTITVSLTEAVVTLIKRQRVVDSLNVQAGETFNLNYKRVVTAFDTLQISVGEAIAPKILHTLTDTLNVGLTDTSNPGDFTALAVTDTLDIEATEDPTDEFVFEIEDAVNVSTTDTAAVLYKFQLADSLSVGLTETAARVIQGNIQRNVTDALSVSLTETPTQSNFWARSVTDSVNVGLADTGVITNSITVAYLQVNDILSVESIDSISPIGTTNTTARAVADILALEVAEIATRVYKIYVEVSDVAGVSLTENTVDIIKGSEDYSWDEMDVPWGGENLQNQQSNLLMGVGVELHQLESGLSQNGESLQVILERAGITLTGRDRFGNWRSDPESIKYVRGLYPVFKGEEGTEVLIRIGVQEEQGDPITWTEPFLFIIGQDTYAEGIISGRYVAVRFESTDQPEWRLLSYDLDMHIAGKR